MANAKYDEAKKLREECEVLMAQISGPMSELKDKLAQYYELMRWQNLESTQEEYDTLYENMVYPYEENDINYHLDKIVDFCNPETREKME